MSDRLSFHRPDSRSSGIYPVGAHLEIDFPAHHFLKGIERGAAHYHFEGTDLGTMTQLRGRPAIDDGAGSQTIVALDVAISVTNDSVHLQMEGRLAPEIDGQHRPARTFEVEFKGPLTALAEAALGQALRSHFEDKSRAMGQSSKPEPLVEQ
ncbi:hypothetical protein FHS95_002447 [Sphingomonas naasensis]|uniref:Uncharacterized protein n=1 Tax=Sphingomonas naasensis TaxID=1344951 RepID=A0A4S1WJ08_9SPHN|nr:hypothetical protein [Sphingomonas naasensis]NIJ20755.1 hypothetical protein [Sphingomonas naasensis]TGX43168.1 hypothetical protein E5A74_08285 [Sphingomonas naasensis]